MKKIIRDVLSKDAYGIQRAFGAALGFTLLIASASSEKSLGGSQSVATRGAVLETSAPGSSFGSVGDYLPPQDCTNEPQPLIGNNYVAHGNSGPTVIKPEDILIADSNAAILLFDRRTGKLMVLASGWPLVQPYGIAVDANGNILVTDTGSRALIRIDGRSGAKQIVTYLPGLPLGLVVNNTGQIFVANAEAVLRIEAKTGAVNLVATGGVPIAAAMALDGSLFVVDASGSVVKVDMNNGRRTVISQGQLLRQPVFITFDENGDLLVADSVAGCIVGVDPVNGAQRIVSFGGALVTPVCIVLGKRGEILVSDPDCQKLDGGIILTNADGTQTPIFRGQGHYVNPRGFVIVRTSQVMHPR